jgi:hypothetical protein
MEAKFGIAAEHQPLVGHGLIEPHRFAVNGELNPAGEFHLQSRGGDDDVGGDLGPSSSRSPLAVKRSIAPVVTEAVPARIAANRSPSVQGRGAGPRDCSWG